MTPTGPRSIVIQGGRAKAYRPMAVAAREAALTAGLEAYDRGDAFLAHELLEPAWMGTRDLAERELLQGLIKLAAGFVHAARGNPSGVAKNLRGSLDRLASGTGAAERLGVDVVALIASIEARLAAPIDAGDAPIVLPRFRQIPGRRKLVTAEGQSARSRRSVAKSSADRLAPSDDLARNR